MIYKIFLVKGMSDDGELEYFPDDGYDYSQHLVKSDELTSGAGFFVQAVGLADKLKDRVFTGEIEKHESEMDPEEAALVRDLVFSADEAEMASDDEFFEGFRCDRTEGVRTITHTPTHTSILNLFGHGGNTP